MDIAVIVFSAFLGSGKPSVTSTSISNIKSLCPVDGSSLLPYKSINIRVSSGMSDSNIFPASTSQRFHDFILLTLSPNTVVYLPSGFFL